MQPTVEPAWKDVTLITALVALATVPALFARDLWDPDEPRYMEVAREMVVRGEYLIPQLNGEVYSEKPPLFFWLAGLLWRAGLGTNAGRIVTVLAVWGTLLLIYFVCRAALGSRTALLATAMAFTSLLLLKFAEIGVLDPLLTLLVSVAVVLGWNALHRKAGPPALSWAGCYAAMGLGTLTKGPVGFLVPALILLTYGLAKRKAVRAGGWTHLAGFAVACPCRAEGRARLCAHHSGDSERGQSGPVLRPPQPVPLLSGALAGLLLPLVAVAAAGRLGCVLPTAPGPGRGPAGCALARRTVRVSLAHLGEADELRGADHAGGRRSPWLVPHRRP
jgi:hypothetical protein